MANEPDELLTTAQAAQLLGVDVRTVNRWTYLGKLRPALELRGRTGARLFHRHDVETIRRDRAA